MDKLCLSFKMPSVLTGSSLLPSNPVVILVPGEYLLLVDDLRVFRTNYTLPHDGKVSEWDSGKLDNGGGKIQISMPGDVDS